MRDCVQLIRLGTASQLTQASGGVLIEEDPVSGNRYNPF